MYPITTNKPVLCLLLLAGAIPASANLIITPTFDSTITNDTANSAAIEATINGAISMYENTFADPINVTITFEENSTGLGESEFNLYSYTYSAFHAALIADATTADDTAALAQLNSISTAPVGNNSNVYLKSANAKALGLAPPAPLGFNTPDGTIVLNTTLTSPGSGGPYNLLPVVEHEIDEVLGLGSTLGLTGVNSSERSPEDFFRFSSAGVRSFDPTATAMSYFSIDGTNLLEKFNNTGNGDYGDWATVNGVPPQVQDAFATPGANPPLNVELRALDVIGYDRVAPEPGTLFLLGTGLAVIAAVTRLRGKAASRADLS